MSASFVTLVGNYPTIDLGRMRHKVSLLAYLAASPITYNASGPVLQWTPIATGLWAALEPSADKGTDVNQPGQIVTKSPIDIGIWHPRFDVKPNMRVQSEKGATYVIQAIWNPLEMDIVLVLKCVALAGNG